jgi:hypothetical protein
MSWKALSAARKPFEGVPPPLILFRPALYSHEELRFFLVHLGESPTVALHDAPPAGVNPVAVESVLGRIYQLEDLRKARKVEWGQIQGLTCTGLAAIQDSIERYLKWTQTADDIHRRSRRARTPIRHPSMHEWDSRKRPHKYGEGADGNMVVTEILSDGTRQTFDVELVEEGNYTSSLDLPESFLGVKAAEAKIAPPTDLIHDPEAGLYQCPICKFSQSYSAHNRKQMQMAFGRMAQHLRRERKEADAHRALYSRVYR